ncbi:MAG: DASS family sodium-coupled anion symporter, partial [Planctomycetales bacterium]
MEESTVAAYSDFRQVESNAAMMVLMDDGKTSKGWLKKHGGTAFALSLVAGIFHVAARGGLAPQGMPPSAQVATAVLLIAATLWITEALPLFVTSFVVLALCLLWLHPTMTRDGVEVEQGVFLAPFFSDVILLFLGGFVLSAALHRKRLDERLAHWMIRSSGDSLPKLMLGVMVVTAFLSMWLSNTAAAAMMLALVLPIARALPGDDPSRKSLLLSVPFAANVGGLGTPIGSPPNAIAMQYLRQEGLAPSFAEWMLIGLPGVVGMLAVLWLFLAPPRDATVSLPIDKRAAEPFDFTKKTWLTIVVAALTALGWMTSAWHGQSPGTVALFPVILFFGTGVLKVNDLRTLSWDVLLLMGGGLCLGTAVSLSGLAEWLVAGIPVDDLSVYWLMVAFAVIACVMSSVMSN